MHAINDLFFFLDCRVYFCDFHREQAWERWLSLTEHGACSHREEILCRIRRIATAGNKELFYQAVDDLKNSEVWKNSSKVQNWFSKTWLPEHKVGGVLLFFQVKAEAMVKYTSIIVVLPVKLLSLISWKRNATVLPDNGICPSIVSFPPIGTISCVFYYSILFDLISNQLAYIMHIWMHNLFDFNAMKFLI